MELLRTELDRDELEEKSMQRHLGVLFVRGGYAAREGALVCSPQFVLQMWAQTMRNKDSHLVLDTGGL